MCFVLICIVFKMLKGQEAGVRKFLEKESNIMIYKLLKV